MTLFCLDQKNANSYLLFIVVLFSIRLDDFTFATEINVEIRFIKTGLLSIIEIKIEDKRERYLRHEDIILK